MCVGVWVGGWVQAAYCLFGTICLLHVSCSVYFVRTVTNIVCLLRIVLFVSCTQVMRGLVDRGDLTVKLALLGLGHRVHVVPLVLWGLRVLQGSQELVLKGAKGHLERLDRRVCEYACVHM